MKGLRNSNPQPSPPLRCASPLICVRCSKTESTPASPRGSRTGPDTLLSSDVVLIMHPICVKCEIKDVFHCSVSCLLKDEAQSPKKAWCLDCRDMSKSSHHIDIASKVEQQEDHCSCNWVQSKMSTAQQQWKCISCQRDTRNFF